MNNESRLTAKVKKIGTKSLGTNLKYGIGTKVEKIITFGPSK